ncbi:MAG: peptidoglycan-associated lipoprotein [Nitrospirales bacterium]|nr:MAG: peptidoglycan-associated lipoprotein [Nitrospirales bacterium]
MTLGNHANKTEELQEEPIQSLNASDSLPVLTPASYYHSPDPPEKLPEFVPSLFFDFNSWTLTNKGKHILELTAMQLKENQKSTLIIEGHCDDRGSEGYNLVLGDKRALAIKDYLTSLGIEKDRLIPVSFGDTHPVCFENHETCHALNRRGYLVLVTGQK